MIPSDRKYTKEHEWLLIEGNVAKIGITDHAQDALGDIVYVELPEVDDEFAIGDTYTTIESVKAASPVCTPVAGRVVEINSALDDEPELLNEAPYEQFIAAIEVSEINDAELLTAEEYEKFLAE